MSVSVSGHHATQARWCERWLASLAAVRYSGFEFHSNLEFQWFRCGHSGLEFLEVVSLTICSHPPPSLLRLACLGKGCVDFVFLFKGCLLCIACI